MRPVCDFNISSKTPRFSVKCSEVWLTRAALQPKLSDNYSAIPNNIQITIAANLRLLQTVDKAVVHSHTSRLFFRRPKRHASHPHDSSGMCLFLYTHNDRARTSRAEASATRTTKIRYLSDGKCCEDRDRCCGTSMWCKISSASADQSRARIKSWV